MTVQQNFNPVKLLQENLPDFLAEGPLLVEFKNSTNTDIKSAVVVTLSSDYCDLTTMPEPTDSGIWALNIRTNQWTCLDLDSIESVQNWPPQYA